ncbi:peptidoglycan bridge formation glycyltransferase FemA/FemB family protein [Candidatus Parcubacteria bacterium]|jgi:lipid II:glycine glycyltransferase (peptidoglycan interpeptide bridge formation enzyme)|nr:MAG: peptidoglycan bridge formation glycyltransferase FemA/FemB family protein [Candidatus Parcubacteria bacterium]
MEAQLWSDQELWESFLTRIRQAPFQQSWAWGEFQKARGTEVLRFAAIQNQKIVGLVLALIEPWRFGQKTLTVFSGPVIDFNLSPRVYAEALGLLVKTLAAEARSRQCLYFHIEPGLEKNQESVFKPVAAENKLVITKAFQPIDTLILDLKPSAQALMQKMHEKTRYNIRLAEKKGVSVESFSGQSAKAKIPIFLKINAETSARDKFLSHTQNYYEKMAEILPEEMLKVYLASSEDQPIAANIVITYADTATYLHGASSNQLRNLMAPHLLQWRQILDAQGAGKNWYDFFGVQTENRQRQTSAGASWAGITRFKQGFGGRVVSYLDAYELPIKLGWYRLLKVRNLFKKL